MRDLSGIVKAYDIRGVVGEQLDAGLVRDFGAAFARLVGGPTIVIGHDMRDSSPGLSRAFAEGAQAQGVNVIRPAGRSKSWAIQIGAFTDKISAHAQLAKYAEKSMDVLGQARRLVVAVPDENGRTTYRARFGLFGEDEARAVCRRMNARL